MIEGLQPYAEYKESGLPWLGRCPKHWSVRRTKILFHERVQKGFPYEPLLAATQTKGVVKKEDYEARTVTAQKDLHLLKLVEVGDYVISLRSFQGGIEVAHCRGIISPAYTVLKPRKFAISGYYTHFFKAKPFIDSLSLFVTGIREGQNIDYERLSRAEMPLPPSDEQAAIVRFLDHANRKIDGFIRAKRKLIALLEEQKQAIIHRAVTRGLDPDVPLKPSGIPWLGDIPRHWEVLRLGRAINIVTGFPFRSEGFTQNESAIRLLRGINVTPVGLRWDATVLWNRSPSDGLDAFALKVDDIVLGMDRPIIASGVRAARVEAKDVPSLLLQRVARLRPAERLEGDFLLLLLKGKLFADYIAPIFTGISVPHLSPEQIRNFKVMLPPKSEQMEIVAHIEQETLGITTAIVRTEREITLMQEYRTRLTADVVTGKLDVREAAAKLPAVSDSISDIDDEGAFEADFESDEE
ncbi:MAG: hypothetical protein EOM03_13525 [Clostridia bacterium]|nr:hypothetical protein [Clostridia bacterium]